MAVNKENSFLAYFLVLGLMFLLVCTVEHADAKACTKECGNLGYGICPQSEGSPENPICTNCCSGFKGCNYYNANGTFTCEGEFDPKKPNFCPLYCDPNIAYSKCPLSQGNETVIYPTGCTTCCTGYKGCYYFDQDGKFECEGESANQSYISTA